MMLAMEPAQCNVLVLVALVLGFCAFWVMRVRSRQPKAAFVGQSNDFDPSPNITTAVDPTASTVRIRQPLQGDPCPADEANHPHGCLATFLRSVSSCLKLEAPVAQAASLAALKAPPTVLPAAAAPSPKPSSTTLSAEAAARLASELCNLCVEIRHAEPGLAREIERISEDIEWLQCFWVFSDFSIETTTALVRSYASLSRDFNLDERRVAEILSAGLIDILPGCGDGSAVVAVVRDIQIIGQLLQTHSFQDVVAAHLMQLKLLLKTSARARQHGLSMVHDLSGLNLALVRSMLDPRNLHAQLHGARFLFTAFPVRFETIVVVDAPPAFGVLLNAVKAVAPGAIPKPLQFVSRPEAEYHCEQVFGQQVLSARVT